MWPWIIPPIRIIKGWTYARATMLTWILSLVREPCRRSLMALALFVAVMFPGLMVLSASMDFLTMRIPNPIPAALTVGYFVLAAYCLAPQAVLHDVSCGLAVLMMTFVMFSLRWIGGGDAKLAAATALWMGWGSILDYGVAAAVCGGLLTLGLLTARARPLPTILAKAPGVARLHERGACVPYGIALAVAGLIEYPHTAIWASIFS
jgi:prepilin peptidase CpaA